MRWIRCVRPGTGSDFAPPILPPAHLSLQVYLAPVLTAQKWQRYDLMTGNKEAMRMILPGRVFGSCSRQELAMNTPAKRNSSSRRACAGQRDGIDSCLPVTRTRFTAVGCVPALHFARSWGAAKGEGQRNLLAEAGRRVRGMFLQQQSPPMNAG